MRIRRIIKRQRNVYIPRPTNQVINLERYVDVMKMIVYLTHACFLFSPVRTCPPSPRLTVGAFVYIAFYYAAVSLVRRFGRRSQRRVAFNFAGGK